MRVIAWRTGRWRLSPVRARADNRRPGGLRTSIRLPLSRGFSLLELVLAVLLLAVLAVVLVPRFSSLGDARLNHQAEQLRRDISRIQLMATSQTQRLRLIVSSSGYSVVACSAPSTCGTVAVSDPRGGGSFAVALNSDVVFSAAVVLDFDSLGRPTDAAGLLGVVTPLVLERGSHSARVDVLPLTGYARVVY